MTTYSIKDGNYGGAGSIQGGEDVEMSKQELADYIEANKPKPTPIELRKAEYGTALEQIEFITENGLTAWKAKVSEIKTRIPK
jgi:hypothetical protein